MWFAIVLSSRHHDGTRVEVPERDAQDEVGDDAMCIARYDDDGAVVSLAVTGLAAPKSPPLWFAELSESEASPPAISLVAFSGHGVDAERLLDRAALREASVVSADQLGAARWYPATGEVDQIYVAPTWRRRSIGSALAIAVGTLSLARGWPRIWGDGQRTAVGDRWRNASPWAHRMADLTHLAPPMTPFDER